MARLSSCLPTRRDYYSFISRLSRAAFTTRTRVTAPRTSKADVILENTEDVNATSTPYEVKLTSSSGSVKKTDQPPQQTDLQNLATSATKPKFTITKAKPIVDVERVKNLAERNNATLSHVTNATKVTKTDRCITKASTISVVNTATPKYVTDRLKVLKTTTQKYIFNATETTETEKIPTRLKKPVIKVPVMAKQTSLNSKPLATGSKTATTEIDARVFTEVSGKVFEYKTIRRDDYTDPPTLAHGLDRILFSRGVHILQDPRTNVVNFSPYLKKIVQPKDIDFNTFPQYITSSQDPVLIGLAKEQGKKFVGSTSSLTNLLCHIYFLISNGKPPNISMLSKSFGAEQAEWGTTVKEPPSVYLRYKDGVYAVDKDNVSDSEHILLHLGRSMELMLTVSPEEFSKSVKGSPEKANPDDSKPMSYFYGTHQDLLFRAQLDVHDPRLPGRTFDLKTRGSIGIRLNLRNYKKYIGYHVKTNQGEFESFEREYYDLIRSAFLKYYFQVCIGKMDGVFMAYHNTETIFGFQYIPKEEMELCLFGNSVLGQEAFGICVKILQDIFKTATSKYPEQSLRLSVNTSNPTKKARSRMTVFTEVVPYDRGLSKDGIRHYQDQTNPKLSKYSVSAYSTVNGTELPVREQLSLSADGSDEWVVHYNMEESDERKEETVRGYNAFIYFQKNFFARSESAKMSPFQRNLYNIARRNIVNDKVAADLPSSVLEDEWWGTSKHRNIGDVTLYDDEVPSDRLEESQDLQISTSVMLERLSVSKDLSKDIDSLSRDDMDDILAVFGIATNGPTFAVRAMLNAVVHQYKLDKKVQAGKKSGAATKVLQDDSNGERNGCADE